MNLTETDLDADWQFFDNIRNVQLFLRTSDDNFAAVQTVQALDVAYDVSEIYQQADAGDDAGQVFSNQTTIALRKSQITGGKVTPGSKVIDWDGKTWYVTRATYKSMDTRVMVVLHT